jgi:hypothetical protein
VIGILRIKIEPDAVQGKTKRGKTLLVKKLSFLAPKLKGYLKIVREIIYGMTIHEMDMEL